MNTFIQLYGEEEVNTASAKLKRAVAVYCAVAALFAAFCATFVALYITVGLNVIICFLFNFFATAAFLWYSVIFFKFVFSAHRERVRFLHSLENANVTDIRAKYTGKMFFADGKGLDFLPCGVDFAEGAVYDLRTVGKNIIAYREADND